ncbi:hypothetical protein GN958_ATG14960 [Phytophthora infestans]|uniref:Uncharacterized protein n=1 Tax=Phytophthora infestans TaxID=4787 RepID=A0A8S9U443_PHYIN|nr:hypothetical protein GN958_ATG22172 [Phytophthora infestans]KAF4135845.1 hypothetical protein GN958_ATG14960 [Phytophthora infestans]
MERIPVMLDEEATRDSSVARTGGADEDEVQHPAGGAQNEVQQKINYGGQGKKRGQTTCDTSDENKTPRKKLRAAKPRAPGVSEPNTVCDDDNNHQLADHVQRELMLPNRTMAPSAQKEICEKKSSERKLIPAAKIQSQRDTLDVHKPGVANEDIYATKRLPTTVNLPCEMTTTRPEVLTSRGNTNAERLTASSKKCVPRERKTSGSGGNETHPLTRNGRASKPQRWLGDFIHLGYVYCNPKDSVYPASSNWENAREAMQK